MFELITILKCMTNQGYYLFNPPGGTSNLGWIVLIIFSAPFLIVILSSYVFKPRSLKTTSLVISILVLFVGGFIIVSYILDIVLGFV